MNAELQLHLDEAALRRTAEIYAQGADRRDAALWRSVMTDHCILEGPGFRSSGLTEVLKTIDLLASMFERTRHLVHNQVVAVTGDVASGETYSTADHLLVEGGREMILTWNIRYQDDWRREAGQWRFARRRLIVDWDEKRAREGGTIAWSEGGAR